MADMETSSPGGEMAYKPDIMRLKRMVDNYRTATQQNAKESATDRDYYDGPGQLSSEVRSVLKARMQPAIWTNHVQPAVDGVLGMLAQGRTDPRAYPRNPADEQAADIATKALRYMADKAGFDQIKLDCAEEHQIEGTAAAIVEIDADLEVTVTQIRWAEFIYDPRARRADFKDARYLGAAKWMYAEDVAALYPERYKAMGDPFESGGAWAGQGDIFDDKPDTVLGWIDRNTRRLLVVELYHLEGGQWMRCVFCAAGEFEAGVSPYQDDKGRPRCPIEAASCYVDRQLMRYGRVRNMRPIQDEVNARRSRALHIANSRQLQEIELGSGQGNVDTAREEAARADGVIPPGWRIVPTRDMAVDNQALLAEAKSELQRMAPTPAVLGRQGGASSGRERLVLQQAGMTELARAMSRLQDWEERIYKAMWMTARQFWQAPKWVRITDDLKAPQFVLMNNPEDPGSFVAQMDVDIIIDSVADTANLAQEVWQELIGLLQTYDPTDPRIELAIEMSPLPDKPRVLERIKAFRDRMAQQAGQQQQQAMALAAQAAELQAAETQANTADKQASAMEKAARADQVTAETNLMQANAVATMNALQSLGMMPA